MDDNLTNCLLATTLLRQWGCTAAEASDGREALAELRQAAGEGVPYRAALLDMQMPGMDGEALVALIKEDPEIAGTKLVMMTSLGRHPRMDGLLGCLAKPVRRAQLYALLAPALSRTPRLAATKAPVESAPRPTAMRRARLLVVEDNPVNQLVAVKLLRSWAAGQTWPGTGTRPLPPSGAFPTTSCSWTARCRRWTALRPQEESGAEGRGGAAHGPR